MVTHVVGDVAINDTSTGVPERFRISIGANGPVNGLPDVVLFSGAAFRTQDLLQLGFLLKVHQHLPVGKTHPRPLHFLPIGGAESRSRGPGSIENIFVLVNVRQTPTAKVNGVRVIDPSSTEELRVLHMQSQRLPSSRTPAREDAR